MKLLIVEDNFDLRTALAEHLREKGHSVVEAANGEIAFEFFHADPTAFHAIISDNSMPEMTGSELNIALQRNFHKFPPFIMITGDDDIDIEPLELYALLTKPLKFKVLDSYIDDILFEIRSHGGFFHPGLKTRNKDFPEMRVLP